MSENGDAVAAKHWNVEENLDIHEDPLLDCLVILTKIYGRNISKASLSAGLPLIQNRLTVELFIRAASRADLAARTLEKPLEDIGSVQLPAILLLHNRQACILVEKNTSDEYKIILPQSGSGEKVITVDELKNFYTGYAIFVRPKYLTDKKSVAEINSGGAKHWFWGTLLESWRVYRDVFLAAFLINVFNLAGIFYVLNIYDRVIPNNAISLTHWLTR